MRNVLFATASLAFVSSPALAADKLSVGVGGYMQQWFGASSVDDTEKDKAKMKGDGVAQQSDSEIFFRGKLESDSGLTFSVKVELEGNNNSDGATAIDESQLTIGGEFGKITLGAEDPASTLTHHGGLDVGISLNCGDTHKWIGGLASCSHNGFGTYGHGHGDKNQVMYFTPRINGFQMGASYIPDSSQEGGNNALNDNDKAAWAVGGNYVGDFGGDMTLELSLGHYQGDQVGGTAMVFDGMMAGTGDDKGKRVDGVIDTKSAEMHTDAIAAYRKAAKGFSDGKAAPADEVIDAGIDGQAAIKPYLTSKMVDADDKTFSNASLGVGFGGFTFRVVYATADGGANKIMSANRLMTADDWTNWSGKPKGTGSGYTATGENKGRVVNTANYIFVKDTDGTLGKRVAGEVADDGTVTAPTDTLTGYTLTAEGADYDPDGSAGSETTQIPLNDPDNDNPMVRMDKVVEDMSKNWDTWGAGVKYTDGPMAVSLSHLATEWDNGDEQEASMLSLSYTLAPGVASKSSLFVGERTMGKRKIDGTGFVTGIVIGF